MNIAVIAASGRSGKAFTEHALAKGHTVRAGVRGTHSLAAHPRLTVVTCDATSEQDLANLVAGQDAVVSFIGHVKGSQKNVQTEAMRAVCTAMSRAKVTRLVSLTGTGVRFPGDKITFIDRLLNTGIAAVDPARIQDGKNHVAFLEQTSLDWTVIRVLKLQNTKPKPFVLKQNGPAKTIVSRHEVAQAALEVLDQDSFIRQAPIVSPSPRV